MKLIKCRLLFTIFILCTVQAITAQVEVNVDASQVVRKVSPYIYGKNNSLSDNPSSPLSNADWTKIKEAGINFFRESGGNNSTKYNWRTKLTSHPDWYNNVYPHDWDYEVQTLQEEVPYAQGMWSFQLLGVAAGSKEHNFNDWAYNNSKWWDGVHQNLAGGGTVNEAGGADALADGDPDLYLVDWPADSTVGILNHWLGNSGLGLDKSKLLYWSMDNEAEIWNGTHDDVMPVQISAEEFMQVYFDVAKKARAAFPEIKLCGPVPANEWQWYNWNNATIAYKGKNYCWLEYFILRVAEEQEASGIRLLDVLDIHFYPGTSKPEEIVQLHRVYFDRSYVFPEANGVKNVNGSWDGTQNKEYVFGRCNDWLTEYMGAGHEVSLGVSETGIESDDPNVIAVWYASTLGEFMKNGVDFFTPWSWKVGMWEVVHLFSTYNFQNYISSSSNDDEMVSAYTTTNSEADSLSIVIVNRSASLNKKVNINIKGFSLSDETVNAFRLSNLPDNETFVSGTNNALEKLSLSPSGSIVELTLPAMSITTLIVSGTPLFLKPPSEKQQPMLYPNPVACNSVVELNTINIQDIISIKIFDNKGVMVGMSDKNSLLLNNQIDLSVLGLVPGNYVVHIQTQGYSVVESLVLTSSK